MKKEIWLKKLMELELCFTTKCIECGKEVKSKDERFGLCEVCENKCLANMELTPYIEQ